MSSFYCGKCGALCLDSERGYTSGCEHYPPDVVPTREEIKKFSTSTPLESYLLQTNQKKK